MLRLTGYFFQSIGFYCRPSRYSRNVRLYFGCHVLTTICFTFNFPSPEFSGLLDGAETYLLGLCRPLSIPEPSVNDPASHMAGRLSPDLHLICIRRTKHIQRGVRDVPGIESFNTHPVTHENNIVGHSFAPFECFGGAGQRTAPASVIILPVILGSLQLRVMFRFIR
jgi:hypothetical protein